MHLKVLLNSWIVSHIFSVNKYSKIIPPYLEVYNLFNCENEILVHKKLGTTVLISTGGSFPDHSVLNKRRREAGRMEQPRHTMENEKHYSE